MFISKSYLSCPEKDDHDSDSTENSPSFRKFDHNYDANLEEDMLGANNKNYKLHNLSILKNSKKKLSTNLDIYSNLEKNSTCGFSLNNTNNLTSNLIKGSLEDSSNKLTDLSLLKLADARNSTKLSIKVAAQHTNKDVSEFHPILVTSGKKNSDNRKNSAKVISFSYDCNDVVKTRKMTSDMIIDSSHGIRANKKSSLICLNNATRGSKTSVIPIKEVKKQFIEDDFILEEEDDVDELYDNDLGPLKVKSCMLDGAIRQRSVSSILSKLVSFNKISEENSDSDI